MLLETVPKGYNSIWVSESGDRPGKRGGKSGLRRARWLLAATVARHGKCHRKENPVSLRCRPDRLAALRADAQGLQES